jgi:hypothetical protein
MVALWFIRVEWQLPAREPYRDYRAFAARVRQLAPRPMEILFFRTEAHPLAFRLGRPLSIVVQWEELNARLLQPGTHYIVTPPRYAEESARYLRGIRLERVLSNTELSGGEHERPLVLLRAERNQDSTAENAENAEQKPKQNQLIIGALLFRSYLLFSPRSLPSPR